MASKAFAESSAEEGSQVEGKSRAQEINEKYLTLRRGRREEEQESWRAFWKFRYMETEGNLFNRTQYWVWRAVDAPITWWREKVVEPLHDKYKRPYFHRKISRVPYIDECGVHDFACIYEANEQYRRDKMVDESILDILNRRRADCVVRHNDDMSKCVVAMEDYEEAELNYFIKYGELGIFADVRDCYFKQKHRMVWERRHPEVMEERARKLQEHKEKLAQGEWDSSFWKRNLVYQDKTRYTEPYPNYMDKASTQIDRPTSKDWEYYKRRQQDPEYDAQERKKDNTGTAGSMF